MEDTFLFLNYRDQWVNQVKYLRLNAQIEILIWLKSEFSASNYFLFFFDYFLAKP